MSRLFPSRSFSAKWNLLKAHGSPLLFPQAVRAPITPPQSPRVRYFNQEQQQRGPTGQSHRFGLRCETKSGVWLCGVGVGLAVAVGLNYQNDAVTTYGEETKTRTIDRYSDARKVSRELVERIKVSSEVGVCMVYFCLSLYRRPVEVALALIPFLLLPRLRSGLQEWWLVFLWMDH